VRDLAFQEVVQVLCPLQGLVGLPEDILSLLDYLLKQDLVLYQFRLLHLRLKVRVMNLISLFRCWFLSNEGSACLVPLSLRPFLR
jgi:hypothetical protein